MLATRKAIARRIHAGAFCFVLALLIGASSPTDAKKAPTGLHAHSGVATPVSPVQEGTALHRMDQPTPPGSAEARARHALRVRGAELGITGDHTDLHLVRVRRGRGTEHVTFRQSVGGIPILGSETVVSLRGRDGRATAVATGYRRDLARHVRSTRPHVAAAAAISIALTHLAAAAAALAPPSADLVIVPEASGARLAWRITAVLHQPLGDWEVLIDATTGAVIGVHDQARHLNDGTGLCFHPDPITATGDDFGTNGLTDSADAATARLDGLRVAMPLFDLTADGGQFVLSGPHARIVDFEAPADTVANYRGDALDDFRYRRNEPGFEAVSAYAHITFFQHWLQVLGFDDAHEDTIDIDPHGYFGADNSRFIPSLDVLVFGVGGVDDAEDPGVLIHEYVHAIHQDIVPGWGRFLESGAMGEGLGDYFGASYAAAVGGGATDWWAKWDGQWTSGAPGLRTVASAKMYPADLVGEVHDDGEIWSSALWAIRMALGRATADALIIQSLYYQTPAATFRDAALALLQADVDLNGGVFAGTIQGALLARGILPILPVALDAAPGDQMFPKVAFDRVPDESGSQHGRHFMLAWANEFAPAAACRRVSASGTPVEGALPLPIQNPDIAFAPGQSPQWEPRYLAVGTVAAEGGADVVAVPIRSRLDSPGPDLDPLQPVATGPAPQDQPVVAGVLDRYAVVYRTSLGGGSTTLGVVVLDTLGRAVASAPPIAGPPGLPQVEPAVTAGYRPTDTGAGRFLVTWMQLSGAGSSNVLCQLFTLDGTAVSPASVLATGSADGAIWHMTPDAAFDGNRYLVVWTEYNLGVGTGTILGRFVDGETGETGPPFLIAPGPAMTNPDVAFASDQFLVVWYSDPVFPGGANVLGWRLEPPASGVGLPYFVDVAPIPIAATPATERWPTVTNVGEYWPDYGGQSFFVCWSQSIAGDDDLFGTFVPELRGTWPAPVRSPLGLVVTAPAPVFVAAGDTTVFEVVVRNSGEIKDAYALDAVVSRDWSVESPDLVPLNPAGMSDTAEIVVLVPEDASDGDSALVTLTFRSRTDGSVDAQALLVVFVGTSQSGVAPGGVAELYLGPGTPNPLRSATTIDFALGRDGPTKLELFDVTGRRVVTLVHEDLPAGRHERRWDGRNDAAERVAPGVYFSRLSTPDGVASRKLIVLGP